MNIRNKILWCINVLLISTLYFILFFMFSELLLCNHWILNTCLNFFCYDVRTNSILLNERSFYSTKTKILNFQILWKIINFRMNGSNFNIYWTKWDFKKVVVDTRCCRWYKMLWLIQDVVLGIRCCGWYKMLWLIQDVVVDIRCCGWYKILWLIYDVVVDIRCCGWYKILWLILDVVVDIRCCGWYKILWLICYWSSRILLCEFLGKHIIYKISSASFSSNTKILVTSTTKDLK